MVKNGNWVGLSFDRRIKNVLSEAVHPKIYLSPNAALHRTAAMPLIQLYTSPAIVLASKRALLVPPLPVSLVVVMPTDAFRGAHLTNGVIEGEIHAAARETQTRIPDLLGRNGEV
jgi:hypothetical protein